MASSQEAHIAYGWGSDSFGQIGIGNTTEDSILLPHSLEHTQLSMIGRVQEIFCGWNHTLFLMENGSVYSCGLNEDGQCGQSKNTGKPERIDALEAMTIKHAGCGQAHSIVVNDKGQMYSFGNNEKGQLGLGTEERSRSSPKLIRSLPDHVFIKQIACGANHNVALCEGGHIYAWGENTFGQVGVNVRSNKVTSPQRIYSLSGCPIYRLAAGGNHTFAMTVSGTLFAWGRNRFGQLGVGGEADRPSPTLVKILRSQFVRYICCGEDHTAVLTKSGGVFTFGCGSSGQLGHNTYDNETNPRQVIDLMGSVVTQIACGRKHTLAYVEKTRRLYSFGLGVSGQLGINSYEKKHNPVKVKGFSIIDQPNSSGHQNNLSRRTSMDDDRIIYMDRIDYESDDENSNAVEIMDIDFPSEGNNSGLSSCLYHVSAGGLHSFAIISQGMGFLSSVKLNKIELSRSPSFMNSKLIGDIVKHFSDSHSSSQILSKDIDTLKVAFLNLSCLNGSFLLRLVHEQCTSTNHGLHLSSVRKSLQLLFSIDSIKRTLTSGIEEKLLPLLATTPPDIEGLRVFLIVPELPFFKDSHDLRGTVIRFGDCLLSLSPEALRVLMKWWAQLPESYFFNLVWAFQKGVSYVLERKLPNTANEELFSLHASLTTSMKVLEKLNEVNNMQNIISYDKFYVPAIMEKIDMRKDYLNWMQQPNVFAFCRYPFVLDAKVKTLLLQTDAVIQMQTAVDETHMFNIAHMFSGSLANPVNPLLVLHIRRDQLVQDTLAGILSHRPHDLKKPLKVVFSNEEAVDAGGVRKEFFLLLMKEILDPKYGMFDYITESSTIWFKEHSFEDPEMFMLIGIICGLAIYNSTIIDVNFPSCLYKKLLRQEVNLDDFRELQPTVARNLQAMLDYMEDDFTDVFDMNFQIASQSFGQILNIDLIPNGENTPVTKENRELYVRTYVDYVLNRSVEGQFNAFFEGFHRVCGGRVLEFFHPQELMEMVVGCPEYDFEELEKLTEYKGDYYRNHPVIINFWKVFKEFNLEMKKKFLAFVTGSSKVPIFGMKSLKFIIQPVAGGEHGDHLPVAHTCFNILDLPRYPTEHMMRVKLSQAVQFAEGFGLV